MVVETQMRVYFCISTKLLLERKWTFHLTTGFILRPHLVQIVIISIEDFTCWILVGGMYDHEVVAHLDLLAKRLRLQNIFLCMPTEQHDCFLLLKYTTFESC